MFHFFEAIQNKSGDALPGYLVKVFDSTGTIVPIYSDNAGTPIVNVSEIADTAIVDSDGNVSLYVEHGTYDLGIYSPSGVQIKLVNDVPMGASTVTLATGATVSTRSLMAAIATPLAGQVAGLSESGREGTFVFDDSDLSAEVTADTEQGVYVAPSSDTTGASGAWVRQFGNNPVDPEWFGVVEGDSAANGAGNIAAWNAMIDLFAALAVNTKGTYYRSLYDVGFGLGIYHFNAPIDLTDGAIRIRGRGKGHGNSSGAAGATVLKFTDCTGIRIQSTDTSGASTKDGASHVSATYSHIADIAIEGSFSGTEAEYHGLHVKATAVASNVNIRNFAGDGVFLDANTATDGGNATASAFHNIVCWNNRDGYHVSGNNAGGGAFIGGHVIVNRRWGINEESTIANSYFGTCISQNGINAENDGSSIGAAVVSSGGNLYGVIDGQESGASTNAPSGTTADNTWWYYIGAGAPASGKPAWASGMTLRAGGPARTNTASRACFFGCYAESTLMPKAQIQQNSLVSGGYLAETIYQNPAANLGTAVIKGGTDGTVTTTNCYEAVSGSVTARLGTVRGNSNNYILQGVHSSVSPLGHQLLLSSSFNALLLTYAGSTSQSNYSLFVSGPNTADQFGTGAAQAHVTYIPRLALGDIAYTRSNARRVFIDSAVPASGAHGQGEYVFYRGATAGQLGWQCTTAGTPGTWTSLYAMTAAKSTGWAAWTGTANRATKDTATATTADIAQTLKALIDDLTTRGVIGA